MQKTYGDVEVNVLDNYVAVCEIKRGPNNFFDQALIADLADAFIMIHRLEPSCCVQRANISVRVPISAAQIEVRKPRDQAMRPIRFIRKPFDYSEARHPSLRRSKALRWEAVLDWRSWPTSEWSAQKPA